MVEQRRARLTECTLAEGSPWREDRVELVDPNTGELVCRLAYRDAVVLAFEIEQARAWVLATQHLRETLDQRRER